MIYLGPHVSIASSVSLAPFRASQFGATGFALYTKNEKRWLAPPLTSETCEEFKQNLLSYNYTPESVLPHASYIINLASPKEDVREKSLITFFDEIKRVESLGLKYLNFHPGSHLNTDIKQACKLIAQALDQVLESGTTITPVLENAAGQGSNIGGPFEELKRIIDYTKYPEKIGVTIDTCHAFAFGYAIDDSLWTSLFSVINHSQLKGIHLNNSLFEQGSRKDRHAPINDGFIAPNALKAIVQNSLFDNLPIILETPKPELWAEEIAFLKEK